MTVEIPISANGVRQATQEIKNLRKEAEAFSKIKLDGVTQGLRRDMEILQRNFATLTRSVTGGEFARRLRASGQADRAPHEISFADAYPHSSQAQLDRYERQFWRSLSRGTRWQQGDEEDQRDLRERRERRERAARDEERQGSGLLRSGLSSVWGGAKFGLGLAGIQTGFQGLASLFGAARDLDKSADEFMRRTRASGLNFDLTRTALGGIGAKLQTTPSESAQLALSYARAAQTQGLEDTGRGARAALGLALDFGADKAQTVQQMAGLSLIGATGGALTPKEKQFALLIGRTVGQHNVPLERGLADFTRLAETSSQRTGGEPPTTALAGYLSALYDVASRPGQKGLRGGAGLSILGQMDQGVASADSPAVHMLLYQGLSKAMNTQNWLALLEQKQKGGLAPVLNAQGQDTGETNFSVLLKQLRQVYGAVDPRALAYRLDQELNMGGIARAQRGIEIEETYRRMGKGGLDTFQKDLARYGLTEETMSDTGVKDLMDILGLPDAERFTAAKAKLSSYVPQKPYAEGEKEKLEALQAAAERGNASDQERFIQAMIKTIAEHGRLQTPYSKLEDEVSDIKRILEKTIGDPLKQLVDWFVGLSRTLGLEVSDTGQITTKGWLKALVGSPADEERSLQSRESLQTFAAGRLTELDAAQAAMEQARDTPDFAAKGKAYQDLLIQTQQDYTQHFAQQRADYQAAGHLGVPDSSAEEKRLRAHIDQAYIARKQVVQKELAKNADYQEALKKINIQKLGGPFMSANGTRIMTPEANIDAALATVEQRRQELEQQRQAWQQEAQTLEQESSFWYTMGKATPGAATPAVSPTATLPPGSLPKGAGPMAKDPKYLQYLRNLELQHGLKPGLLYGVMMAESTGRPGVVSPKGAVGTHQLMPETGKRFGVAPEDRRDPWKNAAGAAKYFAWLQKQPYIDNQDELIASYNAGEGALKRYDQRGGIPPYKETRAYVPKVKRFMQSAPYLYTPLPEGASTTSPAAGPATGPAATDPKTGQLEIIIRQEDRYGGRTGKEVAHQMDLRKPQAHGVVRYGLIHQPA